MTFGRKTGGRQPGTPNKRTLDIQTKLERLGCDPIEGMAKIAMNPDTPVDVKARMYAELAQYIAPKRKAFQVDQTEQRRVIFNIGIRQSPQTQAINPKCEPLVIHQ